MTAETAAAAPADATTPAAPAAEVAAQPAAPAAPAAPVEQVAATPAVSATPAANGAVTGKTQIAQVVATEFPSYDKNSDGNLDKAEFGAWMVALKTASDPSTKATDPTTQSWVGGAFASADTDKSNVVSQTELTTYLSTGAE